MRLDYREIPISFTGAKTLRIGAVSICADVDEVGNCPAEPSFSDLKRSIGMVRDTYPADDVEIFRTNHQVRLLITGDYDGDGNYYDCYNESFFNVSPSVAVGCDSAAWWDEVSARIDHLYVLDNGIEDYDPFAPARTVYYGFVNSSDLMCHDNDSGEEECTLGMAQDFGGNAAFGVTAGPPYSIKRVQHAIRARK